MTRPVVLASIEGRGKGGTEGRTMTGDVTLSYNAAARDKRDHVRRAPIFSKAGRLANELRTYYRDGWCGTLDNDRHGHALFAILLHTVAQTGGDVATKMRSTRCEFAPWLGEAEFERMAHEAIKVRRRWRADKLAQRIGLTYDDRQRLGITMIGAVDMPKDERDCLARERAVAAKRAQRRSGGVIPREQYEAASISSAEPWKAEGISRSTWYRRRHQAGETGLTEALRRKSNAPVRLVSSRPACTASSPSQEVEGTGLSHATRSRGDRLFLGRPSPCGRSKGAGRAA